MVLGKMPAGFPPATINFVGVGAELALPWGLDFVGRTPQGQKGAQEGREGREGGRRSGRDYNEGQQRQEREDGLWKADNPRVQEPPVPSGRREERWERGQRLACRELRYEGPRMG